MLSIIQFNPMHPYRFFNEYLKFMEIARKLKFT